jgi:sugar fermentation stimulation protein A
MKFFGKIQKGHFVSRPNRFTVLCRIQGKTVKAYLPNPGRLCELLLPDAVVYLEKTSSESRKLHYTAVAVTRDGNPVALHTHRANEVVRYLIERNLVPRLEKAEIIKKEVTIGSSRFDFLLRKDGEEILLEVKSCTLFSENVAMFPDAVTFRGRRHIEELAHLSDEGKKGAVLFLVNSSQVKYFMPEYHTDLEFSRSLLKVRRKIEIIPLAIGWNKNLYPTDEINVLKVPWELIEKQAEDRGCYLVLLKLHKDASIVVGELGEVDFKAGFYVYVGSAKRSLSKRIERHRRIRKKTFWHIDHLRSICDFQAALPIRTQEDLECSIAEAVKEISERELRGFGSTDCRCRSHLYYFKENPLDSPAFHSMLQYFRMERPVEHIR